MSGFGIRPRWLALAVTCLLAACGGGGGGSKPDHFTVNTTSVVFNAYSEDVAPPAPQAVTGAIVDVNSTVYLFITNSTNGLADVGLQVTSATTAQLILYPKAPTLLGAGDFQDTVTVKACTDPGGTNQISGSPKVISVTYHVSGIAAAPAAVTLAAAEGHTSASVPVAITNKTGSNDWTTTIAYDGATQGWLGVSPASGSSTAPILGFSGSALPAGTYTATVTFASGGRIRQIPVTYTVRPNLGVGQSSLVFSAMTGQAALPPAQTVPLTTATGTTLFSHAVTYGAGESGWLHVDGGSAPGLLSVSVNTTGLAAGTTNQAVITLTPADGGTAAQISVSYQLVAPVLTLAGNPSFTLDKSATSTDAYLRRRATTGDTGAPLAWTAVSSVPWLTVTPSGVSGDSVELTLVPAELATLQNGTLNAQVIFTTSAPGVPTATQSMSVPLTLNIPVVNYVAPYVAYVGEQQGVILRGGGFSSAAPPTVMFGSQPAQSVQVVSDTEIRALPPAFGAAGQQPVTIANSLGLQRSTAVLVVREHPNYAYASLPTTAGFQDRTVLYDAERDAVFSYCSWMGNWSATNPSTINRYAYDVLSGTWAWTSTFVPELWDIAMSPDGKFLIALSSSRLWLLDPVTFTSKGHVDLTRGGLGTARQLAVTNDGKVLIRDMGLAYSLVEQAFSPVTFPPSIGIVISGDGSRAVVGDANGSSYIPLSIYDASTGLVTASTTFEYFQLPSLDRTGSRYFSGGNLRDRDLKLIGGIPTYMGYMRPDGLRAYEVDPNAPQTIRTWDLVGVGPSFPQLSSITLPEAVDGLWLLASPDCRTLFIPGPNKFQVVPLP